MLLLWNQMGSISIEESSRTVRLAPQQQTPPTPFEQAEPPATPTVEPPASPAYAPPWCTSL